MGMVLGKVDVAEPAFQVLLSRTTKTAGGTNAAAVPYEIRSYGTRFAIETEYTGEDETSSPFRALAKYIGVFGEPQNKGGVTMAMTAPVVMEDKSTKSGGIPIAMTAPVVMGETKKDNHKMMQFILPAEYDSMAKIPQPTDSANVAVKELSPAVGAVHRYSGRYNDEINRRKALTLAQQLKTDGVSSDLDALVEGFQFWGYNPPFTVPALRRNEVWIPLSQTDVNKLKESFPDSVVSI